MPKKNKSIHKEKHGFKYLQVLVFDWENIPKDYHSSYPKEFGSPKNKKYDVKQRVIWLGEIHNAPGHCAVATQNGKVLWFYDTDNFIAVPKDEL